MPADKGSNYVKDNKGDNRNSTDVLKKTFQDNTGVGTWFAQLIQASKEFTVDERVTWVEIEGVPIKMRYETRLIASLLNEEKIYWIRAKEVPRWVPEFVEENEEESDMEEDIKEGDLKGEDGGSPFLEGDSDIDEVRETIYVVDSHNANLEEVSVGKKDSRSEDPFNIYDLLNKKQVDSKKSPCVDDSLKYPPGFTPIDVTEGSFKKDEGFNKEDGECSQSIHVDEKEDVAESFCSGHFKKSEAPRTGGSIVQLIDNLVKVGQTMGYNVDGCIKNMGVIIDSQGANGVETKMESIELSSIKMCWGTSHLIMFIGVWVPSGMNLLLISVYAPQKLNEKKMLWNYLAFVISNWKGEVIIMGDFNEVRTKDERFGSVFNMQGAEAFNMFVANDYFLREAKYDYGLIPFRFFHYWFDVEGFDKLVEVTWNEALVNDSNAMSNMLKKLKYLKDKLRAWNNEKKRTSSNSKVKFQEELIKLDSIIDKGEGIVNILNRRSFVIKSLQDMENLHSLEAAQKAKIKWAIEGDENSKYYHGILNKKRRQSTIRGILVEGNIVNEVQSAFIADKQILDGPFILNELVQWCKSRKKQSMIFKVDFEKAYDSVRWDFLDNILKNFGFGERWRGWINGCLRSLRGSVIVNWSMFKGISLGSLLCLSHMFYADDAVFVGQWSDSNIDNIVHVLDCFYRASGLRINMNKSKLMGIAVKDDKVDQAAMKIGCVTIKAPFSYLGSKVGGSMSRVQSWNEIINRVVAYLSNWKMKTLLIGGRLTLIKSVLGLIPIYNMSIFKVPMKVLQRLESIRCHFFNGNELMGKKLIWVKWKSVLASKEKIGLIVSSLYALNRALMLKWVWSFFIHGSSLWARVIKAIHGVNGKIGMSVKASFLSIWVDIIQEAEKIKEHGIYLVSFIQKKIGNGANTLFWEEIWCGDIKLKKFLMSSFRRDPKGGAKQSQLAALMDKLVDDNTLPEVSDKFCWVKAVPIKVNIHAWKVRLDCLPTRLNISHRSLDIDSIIRPTYENVVELTRHFFTCPLAREIFRKITCWWDVSYLEVSSYEEWLYWLLNIRLSDKYKKLLEGVSYIMWWHIWTFHNKSIFGAKIPSKTAIFEDVVSRSCKIVYFITRVMILELG
ncbi:RNA-directed DNA polymerase, eukaryota, reverse transcriptase zinc-binding domain protein [Tanacetum coccineum]